MLFSFGKFHKVTVIISGVKSENCSENCERVFTLSVVMTTVFEIRPVVLEAGCVK